MHGQPSAGVENRHAVLAGLAGGLYAMYVGFLGPETTQTDVSFNMLLFAIVGGLGTTAGPIVGTLLLSTLTQFLQAFEKYRMLVFGPLLILLVIYFPGGMTSAFDRLRARVRNVRGVANVGPLEIALPNVTERKTS